jgi:hypothetical protein
MADCCCCNRRRVHHDIPISPGARAAVPLVSETQAASDDDDDEFVDMPEEVLFTVVPAAVGFVLPRWVHRGFSLNVDAQLLAADIAIRLVGPAPRFYAVWSIMGDTKWSGIHVGSGAVAYRGLVGICGSFGGLQWKRSGDTLVAARTLYHSRERRPMAVPHLYLW